MDEPEILRRHPIARNGPMIGAAGSVIFMALWFFAALATGDWVLGRDTLSELGGKDNVAAPLFNVGCVFAGVCLFLFGFSIWMRIPELRLASGFVRIAGGGLVLVGIFNINTGLAHGLATLAFFSMIAVGVGLCAYVQIRESMMLPSAAVGLIGMIVSFLSIGLATVPMAEAIAVTSVAAWGIAMSVEMHLGRDGA